MVGEVPSAFSVPLPEPVREATQAPLHPVEPGSTRSSRREDLIEALVHEVEPLGDQESPFSDPQPDTGLEVTDHPGGTPEASAGESAEDADRCPPTATTLQRGSGPVRGCEEPRETLRSGRADRVQAAETKKEGRRSTPLRWAVVSRIRTFLTCVFVFCR